MSKAQVETATLLLRDHFGQVVATVGETLIRGGNLPSLLIAYRSKLGLHQVKQSLIILIQHQLVNFDVTSGARRRVVEYICSIDRVLQIARYPQYILAAKKLYGDAAELIIEELLCHGQLSLSQCVQRVGKRLDSALTESCSIKPDTVKQQFVRLVETHFVERCPNVDTTQKTDDVPTFQELKDAYLLPDAVDIYGKQDDGTQKKRKLDEAEPDASILWRVNFSRFHFYFRDQLLLTVARNKIDDISQEVLRAALRLNELRTVPDSRVSEQISLLEISKIIPDSLNLVKIQVEQYLSLLADHQSKLMRKIGESSGGLYIVDFSNAIMAVCRATVESIIQERFGSKSRRIFNLLLAKGYLEQNEIETFAMLPSKEGKELTYRLLAENIICTKEVAKTSDFAPSRTLYLFHVCLHELVRTLIDRSYKILGNLILRRYHETEEHKALLERYERLEIVIANVRADPGLDDESKEQHVKEAEEVYMTTSEKQTLEQYRQSIARLQQAEMEVDGTLLIFYLYSKYCSDR